MTYANDRNLREKLYKAFVSRASHGEKNNSQIIEEILSLRTKQAKLLGYESWAELSLSTKMAKEINNCLLYTSPSPRDGLLSRMPSSA